MQQFWQRISSLIASILNQPTIVDFVDIIIVAFLLYQLLKLTRETRASQVLKGFAALFVIYWVSNWIGFKALNWILQQIVNSGAIVIVILFQAEIRRALEEIGRASSARFERGRDMQKPEMQNRSVQELVTVMLNMARRRVGALIVIEQQTGLADIVASGTIIDAEISAALIENIFEPNTPLHDGAMIIRRNRIQAAGCILTLSENRSIGRELGTRHRAALGMSETTDSITFIVSEETGIISMAKGGKLTRHLDARALTENFTEIFGSASKEGLLSLLFSKRKTDRDR